MNLLIHAWKAATQAWLAHPWAIAADAAIVTVMLAVVIWLAL